MKKPELIAHRGYTRHFPENTIVGIGAAIEAGARAVEFDIQLTADQVPVLFHDPDMERVCRVKGAIHDFTLRQLQKFNASEPDRFGNDFEHTRIATLEELVKMVMHHPEVQLFVEIKRESVEKFGITTVLSQVHSALAPVRKRCVLISFDYKFLLAARRNNWGQIGVVLQRWSDRKHQIVKEIKPDYLFCNYKKLPRLRPLAKGKAQLALYEIDDAKLAIKLARRGADYIETFSIGELLNALSPR
jgi:glycerophosphoryl diester phosphodiesterase